MQNETLDPVERLYLRLARTLRESRHDAFTAPVTVAEIYQELVPYRVVRTEAGFGMNADYEHALLRLLAGERDRVRLEPASARDAISAELRGVNPNVGVYREFAGCDVWITEPPAAVTSTFSLAEDEMADDDTADAADEESAMVEHEAGTASEAESCMFCDSALPRNRTVRYCPYCGADQAMRPCRSCGEPLEPDWLFCVACGTRPDA